MTKTIKLSTLWKRARKWADKQGLKHNWANVEGAAPL